MTGAAALYLEQGLAMATQPEDSLRVQQFWQADLALLAMARAFHADDAGHDALFDQPQSAFAALLRR